MTVYHENERKVAERLVDIALSKGYSITVQEGEDASIMAEQSRDRAVILEAMNSSDVDRLYFYHGGSLGWMLLIYGNGPGDLIVDFRDHSALEALHESIQREIENGTLPG